MTSLVASAASEAASVNPTSILMLAIDSASLKTYEKTCHTSQSDFQKNEVIRGHLRSHRGHGRSFFDLGPKMVGTLWSYLFIKKKIMLLSQF